MSALDPWHYPRTELARRAFALIEKRLANALVLFGPRRIGKTEFLIRDLGPLAEKAGHRVVYASFWQSPLAPAATLLAALDHGLRGRGLAGQLERLAQGLGSKIKIGAKLPGVAEAGAEIDLAGLKGAPPADLMLLMDQLLGRLARKTKPTVLMLDEVQELATQAANRPLVAALRTSLDKRRDGLAAVFTGSNRDALAAMFSDRQAPFFHFATAIDLEPLGPPFVDHLLAAFRRATGVRLDRGQALAAFEELNRNPFFFRKLLELLLPEVERDIPTALKGLRAGLAANLGYDRLWLSLGPLQRALAYTLARGAEAPFAESNRAEIGRLAGTEPPTIAQTQTALRRLVRLGIVTRLDGNTAYVFDDPELARWIASRPKQAI
ncbi:MAG TPA: AAA family ATPase [Hyphomicrobiaceae bacterium]|nr:AAA family ATPase [Hyphomicrobiaceae bacterium]